MDLCIVVAASEKHDPRHVARVMMAAEKAAGGLDARLSIATSPGEVPRGCRGLAVVLATGGTEHILLEASKSHSGPMVAAGIPMANSISSLAEAAPLLRSRAHIVALPGLGDGAIETLGEALHGLAAASRVYGSKLLLIGEPSPWLIHDPTPLLEKLSVTVEVLDPAEFASTVKGAGWREAEEIISKAEDATLAPGEPGRSLAVARSVFEAARSRGARAVSPACIRFLHLTGANACLAHALQHAGGVTVGCEGDVAATLGLLLASEAQGAPAWQANIAGAWRDRLLLAHCSAPLSMARRFRLRRHFITGGSVTVEAVLGLDEVTLLRLDPAGGGAIVLEAPVLDPEPGLEMQCETQLMVKAPGLDLVERGTGNHYAVARGGLGYRLRAAVESLGLGLYRLE